MNSSPTIAPFFEYYPELIRPESATHLFELLRDNLPWAAGIKSRGVPTRLAYTCSGTGLLDETILFYVGTILRQVHRFDGYALEGVYLNHYRNGSDWTPMHQHPGTVQVILSLGGTRNFKIGRQTTALNNGDVVLFGESRHGVPREEHVTTCRISVAIFLRPLQ